MPLTTFPCQYKMATNMFLPHAIFLIINLAISLSVTTAAHTTDRAYETYATGDSFIRTLHREGGPRDIQRRWRVECLDGEAIVGIKDVDDDYENIDWVWCRKMFPTAQQQPVQQRKNWDDAENAIDNNELASDGVDIGQPKVIKDNIDIAQNRLASRMQPQIDDNSLLLYPYYESCRSVEFSNALSSQTSAAMCGDDDNYPTKQQIRSSNSMVVGLYDMDEKFDVRDKPPVLKCCELPKPYRLSARRCESVYTHDLKSKSWLQYYNSAPHWLVRCRDDSVMVGMARAIDPNDASWHVDFIYCCAIESAAASSQVPLVEMMVDSNNRFPAWKDQSLNVNVNTDTTDALKNYIDSRASSFFSSSTTTAATPALLVASSAARNLLDAAGSFAKSGMFARRTTTVDNNSNFPNTGLQLKRFSSSPVVPEKSDVLSSTTTGNEIVSSNRDAINWQTTAHTIMEPDTLANTVKNSKPAVTFEYEYFKTKDESFPQRAKSRSAAAAPNYSNHRQQQQLPTRFFANYDGGGEPTGEQQQYYYPSPSSLRRTTDNIHDDSSNNNNNELLRRSFLLTSGPEANSTNGNATADFNPTPNDNVLQSTSTTAMPPPVTTTVISNSSGELVPLTLKAKVYREASMFSPPSSSAAVPPKTQYEARPVVSSSFENLISRPSDTGHQPSSSRATSFFTPRTTRIMPPKPDSQNDAQDPISAIREQHYYPVAKRNKHDNTMTFKSNRHKGTFDDAAPRQG